MEIWKQWERGRDWERLILRNWLIWLRSLASPKSVGLADRLERLLYKSEHCLLAEFLLVQERPIFVLLRSSTDGMEGHRLYSKSTNLNANLLPKIPHTLTFRMSEQTSGHCGPVYVTDKINYHKQTSLRLCYGLNYVSKKTCWSLNLWYLWMRPYLKIWLLQYDEAILE